MKCPPELQIHVFKGKSTTGTVKVITDYFPLIFLKWDGAADEQITNDFYDWRQKASAYAAQHGTGLITINDLADMEVPPPTTRKLIAQYAQERDATETGFFWQIHVTHKAVLRGALTAILWMMGESDKRVEVAKDLPDALAKAKAVYERHGAEVPEVPEDFDFMSYYKPS